MKNKGVCFTDDETTLIFTEDEKNEGVFALCIGRDNTFMNKEGITNGIEVMLHIDDIRSILNSIRKYISGHHSDESGVRDLIKDCSYYEGSYLIEDKSNGENIMSGYEFSTGKPSLKFYHVKKD